MTTAAEGMQYAHPDSPAGQAEARAEEERWQADQIRRTREQARVGIMDAKRALLRIEQSCALLGDGGPGSGTLFDVEFEGHEALVSDALRLARVALAAIEGQIPKVDQ